MKAQVKMPEMEGFNGPVTIFEHEIATKIGTIEELQQTFKKLDREDLRGSSMGTSHKSIVSQRDMMKTKIKQKATKHLQELVDIFDSMNDKMTEYMDSGNLKLL